MTAKDLSAHLRSLFVQSTNGAPAWNAADRFPNHAPPPETTAALDSYLASVAAVANPPSLSASTSHRSEDLAERDARVLRDALLECWEAVSTGSHEDSSCEVSAFISVLSILMTADPSPFPASEIYELWWPRCLHHLVLDGSAYSDDVGGSHAVAALATVQRHEVEHQKEPHRFGLAAVQQVVSRERSRSRSASRPPAHATGTVEHTPLPVTLSKSATRSLVALLVKGLSSQSPSGPAFVSTLWEIYTASHASSRQFSGRRRRGLRQPEHLTSSSLKRAGELAESVVLRWARASSKDFFRRASATLAPSGPSHPPLPVDATTGAAAVAPASSPSCDTKLATLTLVASFVRSYPQCTHHLISTPLLPTLIRILVGHGTAASPPPSSSSTVRPSRPAPPDSSADVKAVATLTAGLLAMLLPRIPTSIESSLPSLLLAFTRAACWRADHSDQAPGLAGGDSGRSTTARTGGLEVPSTAAGKGNGSGLEGSIGPYGIDDAPMSRTHSAQRLAAATPDASFAEGAAPAPATLEETVEEAAREAQAAETADDRLPFLSTASELFTVLYGLYPVNLLDFLRDPNSYLDAKGHRVGTSIDAMSLRASVLPMLRLHTISPALLLSTAETERTHSKSRLAVLETADLIADFERNLVFPRLLGSVVGGSAAEDVGGEGGHHLLDEYAGLLRPLGHVDEDEGSFFEGDDEDAGTEDGDAAAAAEEEPRRGRRIEAARPIGGSTPRAESATRSVDASRILSSSTRQSSLAPAFVPTSPRGRPRRSRRSGDPAHTILATYVALKAAARTPSESVARGSSTRAKIPTGSRSRPGSRRSSAHSRSAAAEDFRLKVGDQMALLEEDVEGSGDEGVGHSHSVVGPGQASGAEDATGALARENLMLKNELNFELYLKSQHLQQMGTLHREHVRETGLEAEIQNLQTVNRALRRKLEAASKRSEELREAHAHRKAGGVSYTESLKERSTRYRDEKKAWIEERAKMKAKVEDLEQRLKAQGNEIESSGQRLVDLEFELKSLQPRLASVDNLEQKNKDLTKSLLVWDDDLRRFREQKQQMDVMAAEWKKADMLAASGQQENDDLRAALRHEEDTTRSLRAELEALKARMEAVGAMRARVSSTASAKAAERARAAERKTATSQNGLEG